MLKASKLVLKVSNMMVKVLKKMINVIKFVFGASNFRNNATKLSIRLHFYYIVASSFGYEVERLHTTSRF